MIVGNTGNGIGLTTNFFGADDVTGTIAGNVVAHNHGAGISLTGDLRDVGAVQISQNIVTANGGTGIEVTGSLNSPRPPISGGPVTIAQNTAMFNGGQGINASWIPSWPTGVVDGGGNRARGNATAPACVGVVCETGMHHKP